MSSVKKNFFYQSIYEVLIIILPLLTSPYIARVLGAEKIGIYSYTYSVAYYFMLIAMLGIKNYGNRAIATVRDDQDALNREFSNIFALHAVLSTIAIAAYIIYCFVFVQENRIYAVIQIFWVIGALFDINWFFFGIEKFKLTVTRNTVIKLITVASIFIFVHGKEDLWKYVFIMAVGNFISQSVVWAFLRNYVRFIKPSIEEMGKHFKPMVVLFIPVLAVSLYKYMDKIMLGVMCEKAQVGFYENAEKAINIPTSVISAFGTVMMPKMSNLIAKGDQKSSSRYLLLSMELVMCLAIGMSLGLGAVARSFSVIMWGSEFSECGVLIFILCVCTIFMAFANILRTQYIIPQKKDNIYIIAVCIGAVTNILVNALLIPRMQARGAAIGTVCAEAIVCIIQAVLLIKKLPIFTYVRNCVFFIFAGVVMYGLLQFIEDIVGIHFFSLLFEIVMGAFVYLMMCLIYFIVKKNEVVIDSLKQIKTRVLK